MALTRFDIQPPGIISLAGVDDRVPFEWMFDMGYMYGPWWGILMHPDKWGEKRYPSKAWVLQLNQFMAQAEAYNPERDAPSHTGITRWEGWIPTLCAHLCGDYAMGVLEDQLSGVESLLEPFRHAQLNVGHLGRKLTDEEKDNIRIWASENEIQVIVQVNEFPYNNDFQYILDRSRGKGISPTSWPHSYWNDRSAWDGRRYPDYLPLFAGGLGPDNIIEECNRIYRGSQQYGVDMESGIRDKDNEFDFDKARIVLEKLIGKREIFWNDEGRIDLRFQEDGDREGRAVHHEDDEPDFGEEED